MQCHGAQTRARWSSCRNTLPIWSASACAKESNVGMSVLLHSVLVVPVGVAVHVVRCVEVGLGDL